MKHFAAVLAFVFAVSVVAFAQSGRRPTALPAPVATPAPRDETVYSESKSRRTESQPSLRGGSRRGNSTPAPAATPAPTPRTIETNGGEALGDDENEVLKIETALVTIPVSVFDRNGRYIPALQQSDFKIFENGVEQEVAVFNTAEKPFSVILLIDVSRSTEFKIDEIQNAAIAFVNQLQPQDRVMVIEFSEKSRVLSELTSDRDQLVRAIRRADFGSGTSLYDAVDDVLRRRLQAIEGRKAVVLFTDGVDTTSYKAGYDDTLHEAQEADALFFPIYYNTFGDQSGGGGVWGGGSGGGVMSSPFPPFPLPGGGIFGRGNRRGGGGVGTGTSRAEYARGRQYLEDLAENTGGRMYDTGGAARSGLDAAFASVAEELRRQYSIGYYPKEVGQPGERRKIKVRVMVPNAVVRARDSYIVGNEESKPQTATAPKKFGR